MAASAGRISIAISVLLMGGFGLWTSLATVPLRPDIAYLAEIDTQMKRLSVTEVQGQAVPPEIIERMRLLLQHGLVLWRELWAMPGIRATVWFSVMLNLASIIAGVGWLSGQPWAARLGLVQAGAFLPFAIVSWWPMSLMLTRIRGLVLVAFVDRPMVGQLANWLYNLQSALLWTNTLMLLGWNGFLVWYFLRVQRQAQHV